MHTPGINAMERSGFAIWKPRRIRAGTSGYHASRCIEEQARARLASTPRACFAHLKLSELHRIAAAQEALQEHDPPPCSPRPLMLPLLTFQD